MRKDMTPTQKRRALYSNVERIRADITSMSVGCPDINRWDGLVLLKEIDFLRDELRQIPKCKFCGKRSCKGNCITRGNEHNA